MLNKNGERELAYVVEIDNIIPIEGADRVEQAVVGGWHIMVRKGQFQVGDLAIYFEIDSKVPEKPEFEFLASKHYKIKTQKYFKGTVISQGLLMAAEDFGWKLAEDANGQKIIGRDTDYLVVGDFLTKELGVTYADVEDNKRKVNTGDKYKKMAQRNGKLFAKKPFRWLMKREWGRKLLFLFFGKKRDKKGAWPAWVVKTDEERIQNLVGMIPSFQTEKWIPTEKIDGTSTTFTMRSYGRKKQFYICSRNVVFDKPDKKCFYETNVYTEMAEKYNIEQVLSEIMKAVDFKPAYVTIQGETYGDGIQKRDYSIEGHDFMAFNVIFGMPDGHPRRLNPKEMTELLAKWKIPCVPFFEPIELPGTCEEILAMAAGASVLDGKPREGLVFRTLDGCRSFKAVDNSFLLKYHG